jgi:hypothetical protein
VVLRISQPHEQTGAGGGCEGHGGFYLTIYTTDFTDCYRTEKRNPKPLMR